MSNDHQTSLKLRLAPLPDVQHRRTFLSEFASSLAGIAFTSLLKEDDCLKAESTSQNRPLPHHPARAKRVIQIFLGGGLSQIDSFDYKPALEHAHGSTLSDGEMPKTFNQKIGQIHKSFFKFRQRGESGLWVSDLFPKIAKQVDLLTIVRSMTAFSANHQPAVYQANSGFQRLGYPSIGSWLSYGLGNETDTLPTFVVIPDARILPSSGSGNWSSGFLPTRHQGVMFRSEGEPVKDLHYSQPEDENLKQARLKLLREMNLRHLQRQGSNDLLTARMRSYELAARMQVSIPKVADLAHETEEAQRLYGLDRPECSDFARSCLLSRRLIEQGVRYVQLWSGGNNSSEANWDAHGNVLENHSREALRIDRPVAALLQDLKRRGLLDDTLVIFNTEFGRTPFTEIEEGLGTGRDHNHHGFTNWLAGAGLKPGFAFGSTDEIGYKVVEDPVDVHDFHATVLYLLGIDHERLTFSHNGAERRLTDVSGHVVKEILA